LLEQGARVGADKIRIASIGGVALRFWQGDEREATGFEQIEQWRQDLRAERAEMQQ
jgi:hypothetical protein